ncbi:hypothetical protein AVEN_32912-1 [Araneus ventricosus]|uniref:BTB domain-containing protein n=1 Tax=Araneus ventricosus TaxID=182803 RepID=A0A4Y2PP90_ARAVE|nr:hypothetical protein AVEN_32912-1 [Araneus ventricosus]
MPVQNTPFEEIFKSGFWKGMEQFTNGTLQTDDGTTFRIHRVVLSPRSEYFRALFSFNFNEKAFVIPNINSKMLESLLVHMYTGTITLDGKKCV